MMLSGVFWFIEFFLKGLLRVKDCAISICISSLIHPDLQIKCCTALKQRGLLVTKHKLLAQATEPEARFELGMLHPNLGGSRQSE